VQGLDKRQQDTSYIQMVHLTKTFGEVLAVDDFCLDICCGEFVTLLGPSGSGKTTTLRMVAGFEEPTSGEVYIDGLPMSNVAPEKRNTGMVFQSYTLFPHMTVAENIAFPLKMRRSGKVETEGKIQEALRLIRLPGYGDRFPRQLSGGQQQRVALARAVVFNPRVLLMDEPLGALDKKLREEMQLEIKHIQREIHITVIYVTHDQSEALTMSDRIVIMHQGRIQQVGTPDELYEKPVNRFVADFIGNTNLLDCTVSSIEGGICRVTTTNGASFDLPYQPSFGVGATLQLALRPERILLVAESANVPNAQRGVVEERIYLGDVIRYQIKLDSGDSLLMNQPNSIGITKAMPGEQVRVYWDLSAPQVIGSKCECPQ